jgi:hypothetical protein
MATPATTRVISAHASAGAPPHVASGSAQPISVRNGSFASSVEAVIDSRKPKKRSQDIIDRVELPAMSTVIIMLPDVSQALLAYCVIANDVHGMLAHSLSEVDGVRRVIIDNLVDQDRTVTLRYQLY